MELINFESQKLRKIWHEEEWWFSIIDIIAILTDSKDASNYWTMLKKREPQLSTICGKFKFKATDGKMRPTDCANTEGVLRVIMSVPSSKAEPLKLWLAQTGKERIEEIENPELGFERIKEIYQAKGYSEEWIAGRLKTIEVRKELTNEWKKRGVKEGQEYSILTAVIAKGTFGLTPSEHKEVKGLSETNENLRDHMTQLELIFTALGEELTRGKTVKNDAQGFMEAHDSAVEGGELAGKARKMIEENQNEKVVSSSNHLKKDNKSKEIES